MLSGQVVSCGGAVPIQRWSLQSGGGLLSSHIGPIRTQRSGDFLMDCRSDLLSDKESDEACSEMPMFVSMGNIFGRRGVSRGALGAPLAGARLQFVDVLGDVDAGGGRRHHSGGEAGLRIEEMRKEGSTSNRVSPSAAPSILSLGRLSKGFVGASDDGCCDNGVLVAVTATSDAVRRVGILLIGCPGADELRKSCAGPSKTSDSPALDWRTQNMLEGAPVVKTRELARFEPEQSPAQRAVHVLFGMDAYENRLYGTGGPGAETFVWDMKTKQQLAAVPEGRLPPRFSLCRVVRIDIEHQTFLRPCGLRGMVKAFDLRTLSRDCVNSFKLGGEDTARSLSRPINNEICCAVDNQLVFIDMRKSGRAAIRDRFNGAHLGHVDRLDEVVRLPPSSYSGPQMTYVTSGGGKAAFSVIRSDGKVLLEKKASKLPVSPHDGSMMSRGVTSVVAVPPGALEGIHRYQQDDSERMRFALLEFKSVELFRGLVVRGKDQAVICSCGRWATLT